MGKGRVPTRIIKHDEFVSAVSRLLLYLEGHPRRVGAVGLGLAVLAAALVAAALHSRGRSREADLALGSALATFRSAPLSAAASPGAYAPALEEFLRVREEYPRSGSARTASFYAGLCLVELGRREEAREALEEFVRRFPKAIHAPQARLALARLAEEGNEPDLARRWYGEAAEQDSLALPRSEALLELARFLERAGDREEAARMYGRLQSEFPDSEFALLAQQRAQVLIRGDSSP